MSNIISEANNLFSSVPGFLTYLYTTGTVMALIAVVMIAAWCLIFRKAGRHWALALIPVYGTFLSFSIFESRRIFVLILITLVTLFVSSAFVSGMTLFVFALIAAVALFLLHVFYCRNISEHFGKRAGFTLGLIFLFPIFLVILAFDSSVYSGNAGRITNPGVIVNGTWTCACGAETPISRITCSSCGAQKIK